MRYPSRRATTTRSPNLGRRRPRLQGQPGRHTGGFTLASRRPGALLFEAMTPPPRPGRPLLSAAVALFAERGYAASSEEDLCEALALDPVAFRRRFASKQGSFLLAYDRVLAVAHATLAGVLPNDASWAARLATGLHCLFELLDANPAAARLVLVQSQLAGQSGIDRYTATLESLAPFMREGRECSTAPEHLPPIIDSVLPAGVAFSLRLQLLRGEPARDLYPEMLRFLLLPYLGETETAAHLALSPRPGASGPPE